MSEDTLGSMLLKANEEEAKQSALRSSLTFGMTQNPETWTKASKVGATLGITPSGAQQDLPLFEQAARANSIDYDGMIRTIPRSATWLSNPDNAAAAHDDLDMLAEIEQASQNRPPGLTDSKWEALKNERLRIIGQEQRVGAVRSFGNKLAGGVTNPAAGWLDTLAAVPSLLGSAATEIGNFLTSPQSLDTTAGKIWETVKNPGREGTFGGSMRATTDAMRQGYQQTTRWIPQEMLVDEATGKPFYNPDYSAWKQAGENLVGIPGMIALFAATGRIGPTVGPGMAAATAGRERFEQAVAEGQDVGTAAARGTAAAALNWALMTKVPHPVQTATLGGALAQQVGRGVALGTGMTGIENTLDTVLGGPERPWYTGLGQNLTTFLGFELSPMLPRLVQAAEGSRLRARSETQFRDAVKNILEGTEAENVLVPADRLEVLFQDKLQHPVETAAKIEAALGEEVAKRYLEAKTTGTDVVIPTADVLSKFSTDQQRSLLPDMKTRQDQMSMREYQEWTAAGGPEKVRQALEGMGREVEGNPEYEQVRIDLQKRYEAAGETPEVAADYARLNANVITYLAREGGMKPTEALKIYDPQIKVGEVPRETPEQVAARVKAEGDSALADPVKTATAYAADKRTAGGKILNGDLMAEIASPAVKGNPLRGHAAMAEHGAANRLVNDLYEQRMAQPAKPGEAVLILVGNAATGKSGIAEDNASRYHTVLDTNQADPQGLVNAINLARRGGYAVDLLFVHAPVGEAVRRNLGRYTKEGRPVPILDQADLAVKTPASFVNAFETFSIDPQVTFSAIETTPSGKERGALQGQDAADFAQTLRQQNAEGSPLTAALEAYTGALGGSDVRLGPETRAAFERGLPDEARAALPPGPDGRGDLGFPGAEGAGPAGPAESPGGTPLAPLPPGATLLQPPGERAGVSAHVLGVERLAREVAKRSTLGPEEKAVVQAAAAEHGLNAPELEKQARETKLSFPARDGWAPMELAKVTVKDGKAELEWKTIPYSFDREGDKSLKQGSPEYMKRVDALAKGMRDEVLAALARAQGGDAIAENILKQAGWYKEMRTRLRHEFGGLGDIFADLLGATSPNTPVRENWKNAVDVLRKATKGDFDKLIPEWSRRFEEIENKEKALEAVFAEKRALGLTKAAIKELPEVKAALSELSTLRSRGSWDTVVPLKDSGAKYGFNGYNVARALVDLWRVVKDPNADVGRGETAPKALNFSGNLIGFREKATIDVWAARMLNRLAGRERVPGPAESGVGGAMLKGGETKGQFRFGQDVFSEAARLIREDPATQGDKRLREIGDDDLQAVAWFLEKELWTRRNWTSAAGEGGSFELEANLTGSAEQARIKELRKVIDSRRSTKAQKAEAQQELDQLHRTVDRFQAGLSVQQSAGTQGVDYVPSDGHQAVVQEALRQAIYGSPGAEQVVASKVVSTQGRYMGEGERSIDLEVVAKEGFDPGPLHAEVLRQAQENRQQSAFFARVLRAEEEPDLSRHRPGVEIYFRNKGSMADLQPLLDRLHAEMPFYTVVMDGNRRPGQGGAEGNVVGVRVLYMPEFMDNFDGLQGLAPKDLKSRIKLAGDTMSELADKIARENPEVTSALQLWYDAEVTFADRYQEKIDGISGRTAAGVDQPTGGEARPGRTHLESLADAARFLGAPAAEPGGEPGAVRGGDAAVPRGSVLLQPALGGDRGWFRVLPDGTFEIGKTKVGDLSTFIHEPAHGYLYMLSDIAGRDGSSETIRKDFSTVLEYLGGTDFQSLTREQHEKFARSVEKYLQEGKAPSATLRGVFHRFAIWLGSVFHKADLAGVELSPEIRQVFDRMFAGDKALEEAQKALDMRPLFASPEDMGVTAAEFKLYSERAGKAISTAREAVAERLLEDYRREQESWWKEARGKLRDAVEEEVKAEPDYRAIRVLSEGKLEDGTEVKLNKQALVDRYGEGILKELPRRFQRLYSVEGGLDAESAAEVLGYESGDHLIQALKGAEPMKARIERITDERMKAQHGDLMADGKLPDLAVESLHNNAREEMLAAELKALRAKQRELAPGREFQAKQDAAAARDAAAEAARGEEAALRLQKEILEARSEAQRQEAQAAWEAYQKDQKAKAAENKRQARAAVKVPPREAFVAAANAFIADSTARDLSPYSYLIASRKAARESEKALISGDYAAAADAKQKELLNHHMFLAATKAKEEIQAIADYGKKGNTAKFQGMLGLAGQDIRGQWNALAQRYEFRTISFEALDARREKTLEAWAAEQEAAGEGIIIDPALMQESQPKNWREVKISELRAVRDGLKNIEAIARRWNKITTALGEVDYHTAVVELVDGARGNLKENPLPLDPQTRTNVERAVQTMKALNVAFAKFERMIDHLDQGDINGPWRRYIFEPLAEAQYKEYDLNQRVTTALGEAMAAMPKKQRHAMLERHNVEGIGVLSRKAILTLALNMGNASNRDKMIRGMGWADKPEKIWKALDLLNADDWAFVQKTWDAIDQLWPEIRDLQERMVGVAPPRVERESFTVKTADGQELKMAGGYFPMVYDRTKSTAGAKQADVDIMGTEGGFNAPVTFKGHTKERVDAFAAPIELDFEKVLVHHVAKVIRDLSHREAVTSVAKLIRNQDVRLAVAETMGQPYADSLMPWLKGTVNNVGGSFGPGTDALGRLMMGARSNLVLAALAFRASSVVVQVTDFGRALTEVKPRYLGEALLEFGAHPIRTTKRVREMSREMAARSENLDRDTREMMKRMQGKDGYYVMAQKAGMEGLAWADAVTSVTTWLGAHKQAEAAGESPENAVRIADRAVRLTMMSSAPKDMVEVQRAGNLAMKFLTMFMGDATATYGIMNKGVRDIGMGKDVGKSIFKMAMIGAILPVVGQIIKNRGPKDDEDKIWWATKAMLLSLPGSIPILRDIAQAMESGQDYQFTPLAGAVNKTLKSARITRDFIAGKGNRDWEDIFLHGFDSIGTLAGLPGTSQVMTSAKYLHDVKTGKVTPPENPILFARDLVFGPKPKGKK